MKKNKYSSKIMSEKEIAFRRRYAGAASTLDYMVSLVTPQCLELGGKVIRPSSLVSDAL
jgi:hypothetical protein